MPLLWFFLRSVSILAFVCLSLIYGMAFFGSFLKDRYGSKTVDKMPNRVWMWFVLSPFWMCVAVSIAVWWWHNPIEW